MNIIRYQLLSNTQGKGLFFYSYSFTAHLVTTSPPIKPHLSAGLSPKAESEMHVIVENIILECMTSWTK